MTSAIPIKRDRFGARLCSVKDCLTETGHDFDAYCEFDEYENQKLRDMADDSLQGDK